MSARPSADVGAPRAPGSERPLRRLVAILGLPPRLLARLGGAALLGAGAMVCAVGLIATSAWLISRSSQRPHESVLALAIVGVQAFALGRALLRYAERLAGHDAALRALARVRARVYERLERLAPAGLPAFRSGDLLARLVQDVDALQDALLRVGPPFAIALLVGSLTVALLALMLPAAGVVLAVALVLAGAGVPWLSGRLAERQAAGQAAARGELSAAVLALLSAADELAVAGALDGALRRAGEADARVARAARHGARTAGVGQGLSTMLGGLAMWGSLSLGVAAVADGRLDGVLLAGLALIPLVAFELVAGLPAAAQALRGVLASSARVGEVLDAPAPVPEGGAAPPLAPGSPAISLRGLTARRAADAPPALDGVDLELAPGARVGIVGESGAGKSTLAWVLLRFLPYEGSALLAGRELAGLDPEQVRRIVGMVDDEAHIFDTTIAENLLLARRDAGEEALMDALARVRLRDWVRALPEGLATETGREGERMSAGQRRRLALARALLADFPVLVLDEPAEHLDAATAQAIAGDLLAEPRGRTIVLISHRLAGIEQMDEIVVLERGRVAERGGHAELLARGGRYTRLWQAQRGPSAPPA